MIRMIWALGILLLPAFSFAGTPCDGMKKPISETDKKLFPPRMAEDLSKSSGNKNKAKKVTLLKKLAFGRWQIIYVETDVADPGYFFYKGDAKSGKFITTWGGTALEDEGAEIYKWVKETAKGIPDKLAKCFSWYVTDRTSENGE